MAEQPRGRESRLVGKDIEVAMFRMVLAVDVRWARAERRKSKQFGWGGGAQIEIGRAGGLGTTVSDRRTRADRWKEIVKPLTAHT